MRTTEAARYARWAGTVAILIAVMVAGVYLRRALRESKARREAPPPVAPTVQQQSAGFSFSKVEKDRTLFTVRASHATEFKDESKSLLEDVWITIYGREGSRFDNLHTRECNYEPSSGHIVCAGDVQIDLESMEEAKEKPGQRVVHVATKNVSFDRETGVASSKQAVEFRFPYGEGRGVGITYDTRNARLRLEHEVELRLAQKSKTTEPVTITGESLEYGREEHTLRLFGPVRVSQGKRELTAEKLTLELDANLHARQVTASGKPELRAEETSGKVDIAAGQFVAFLNSAGWTKRIVADGGVRGSRTGKAGRDDFNAQKIEIEMTPPSAGGYQPRELNATGDVILASKQQGETRRLETASLRMEFAEGTRPSQRRIANAETLSPGVNETKSASEDTQIRAQRFSTQFDAQGRLAQLLGHTGVETHRRIGSGAPQATTADELAMTFAAGGEWATLEESGKVRFRQGDRTAEAGRARMVRATDTITLENAPTVADAQSRTTAATIEINQRTGDVRAGGSVRSSYFSADKSGPANFSPEPAHVTAESLLGNSTTGRAVYSGGARLWQGDAVIEAETIELWRTEQQIEARGNVLALVPEAPDPKKPNSRPTLWRVRAPKMHYWSAENRAELEGGVSAESQSGDLSSRILDLYLSPAAGGNGQRQLSRAAARGDVIVRQGDRRGAAERGEYVAAEGKFVLSGGKPTLTDALQDTTTGRQLTFFTANDTILVESSAGSRTLTKHRVEK